MPKQETIRIANRARRWVLLALVAFLTACGGGGGGGGDSSPQPAAGPTNTPPVANAGPNRNEFVDSIVILDGNASFDPDGTITAYRWSQISGTAVTLVDADSRRASFTAPSLAGPETLRFGLEVTDNSGGTGEATVDITILIPPVAVISVDNPNPVAGETVTLDGSASFDPDAAVAPGITSFDWQQLEGDVVTLTPDPVNPGVVSFVAPSVSSPTELVFELAVTDSSNTTITDTTAVDVRPGPTLSGDLILPEGVTVDGDVNDPNAGFVPNNTFASAQTITNPGTAVGFANTPRSGDPGPGSAPSRLFESGDARDIYRAQLLAGQVIRLAVADADVADLDLQLFDTGGTLIDGSYNETAVEEIIVPADGEYFLEVTPFSGASSYILVLNTATATSVTGGLVLSADFRTAEAVVRTAPGSDEPAGMESQGFTLSRTRGDASRGMLMSMQRLTTADASSTRKQLALQEAQVPAQLAAKRDTLLAIKGMRHAGIVEIAEPNFVFRTQAEPNDPSFDSQWHYQLIDLPAAWDITTGSESVVVAVLDSGVLLGHPDLSPQLNAGFDFISDPFTANDGDGIDDNPNDPGDSDGPGGTGSWHGTHVAGTVAARTDNGQGVAGSGWDTRIMPVRVLGRDGGSLFDIAEGVRYAAGLPNASGLVPAQSADIINMSIGCLGCFSQLLEDTILAARNAGVVVVASAGNDSSATASYPAAHTGVISVSAVGADSQQAYYSNFGATIDVAAPGGDQTRDLDGDGFGDGVLSTLGLNNGNSFGYGYYQGTSMAAPHVSGVIALMLAVNPSLTPADIDNLLESGELTTDVGPAGRDNLYGFGLINASRAVNAAVVAGGGTVTTTLRLTSSTTTLNFGLSGEAIAFTLGKSAPDPITVSSVSNSEAWLSISPRTIDAEGLGIYEAAIDRTILEALGEGLYRDTIAITSSENALFINVVAQVVAAGTEINLPYVYIILVDELTNETIAQVELRPSELRQDFSFENIPVGSYIVAAGTDLDNDFAVCDNGEACGTYLTLEAPLTIEVTDDGDISGLDTALTFVTPDPFAGQSTDTDTEQRPGYDRLVDEELAGR